MKILALLLEKVTDDDTLQLVLAIVALSISDLADMELSSRKLIKEKLLKPIEKVAKSGSKTVKRTATDLVHVIVTGGAVQPTSDEADEKPDEVDKIAELTKKMDLSDWEDHLTDKLLPIRAGALRELTRGIKQGASISPETKLKLKNAAQIALQSKESFLFLSGIEALATLALEDNDLMKVLIERLKSKNGNLALQSGEILARICPQLGDVAPYYALQIVPIILQQAQKASDSLVIASSLSAGADLIPLLGFYIHDIQVRLRLFFKRYSVI